MVQVFYAIDFYLVQSFYALNHLISKEIEKEKILYLSDYLNEGFLKDKTDISKEILND